MAKKYQAAEQNASKTPKASDPMGKKVRTCEALIAQQKHQHPQDTNSRANSSCVTVDFQQWSQQRGRPTCSNGPLVASGEVLPGQPIVQLGERRFDQVQQTWNNTAEVKFGRIQNSEVKW